MKSLLSAEIPLIVSATECQIQEGSIFAAQHQLEFREFQLLPPPEKAPLLVLLFDANQIALHSWWQKAPGPVAVDFAGAATQHRQKHGGGRGEMIAKAVGLKKDIHSLRILDATGGLGRDAWVLAALGCEVTVFERNPVIFALLADGLRRARQDERPDIADVANRIELREGKADFSLQRDVYYLDPMFPERQKSGAVKKEMVVFQQLLGKEGDADDLLPAALAGNSRRVVVKRPKGAPHLGGIEPSLQVKGKSSRFDVYPKKALKD